MISVKDLMLGNLVKDRNGEIVVVGKVHRESVADKWGGLVFDDEIEGVPVTIDILKAIGFEEYITAGEPWPFWRYWDKDGRFRLSIYGDFWCNSDRKFILNVDNGKYESLGCGEFTYVHELQNLVRVITGHSLPITKEVFDGLGNKSK